MKKIILVFGTRPEAIKMAPVFHELRKHSKKFKVIVCVSAQHREMLDPVLELFEISPDIDLDIMKDGQDLFDITSSILTKMKDVLAENNPDLVLVHGDTTTAFTTSLACFYLQIKIGHIEAGLRTNDMLSPFPEEFNRQVISMVSELDFAPTNKNLNNLSKTKPNISITGNTVIDSLHWVLDKIESDKVMKDYVKNHINQTVDFDWEKEKFILITGHRRENFGEGFLNICHAIADLAKKYKNVHFLYPVHLNPNVQIPVTNILSNFSNIHLVKPLDYQFFVLLLKHSYIVLTDSGGIQEEAPSLGKPVLVMRDVTERQEAVEAGTVELIGTNRKRIVSSISDLIDDSQKYEKIAVSTNPYGNGDAAKKIAESIIDYFY